MGADLILAWIHVPLDESTGLPQSLNLAAALKAVDTLPEKELFEFDDAVTGGSEENPEEIRVTLRHTIEELVACLDSRHVNFIIAPDSQFGTYITGGLTGGDDPTEEFTLFNNLGAVPRIMTALNLYTDDHAGWVIQEES